MTQSDTGSAAGQLGFADPLADLYAQRCLDPVVELVSALGDDVVKHPSHYRSLPAPVTEGLVELRTSVGTNPDWPDATERATLAGRRLGASLCGSSAAVRRAAIVYLERGPDRSEGPLRRRFVEQARAFRAQRRLIDEGQTASLARRTGRVFGAASQLLSTEAVARAMGLPAVPQGGWPDGGIYSLETAQLCGVIAERIERPRRGYTMSVQKFCVLQRVAYHGATTIAALADDVSSDEVNEAVIEAAYRWAVALQQLLAGVDPVRAWTDPSYRRSLEVAERDILPAHPAGDLQLSGTALDPAGVASALRLGFDTITFEEEVCCCSGDFCGGTDYCGTTDTGFTCRTSSSCLCGPT
jgi:mersacidin/lichenicidin family type 2 lantibiotic